MIWRHNTNLTGQDQEEGHSPWEGGRGALSFHKTLSSYNKGLDENARVNNLPIRVDGPQLLSLQIVEKHTVTREISYCGFFCCGR